MLKNAINIFSFPYIVEGEGLSGSNGGWQNNLYNNNLNIIQMVEFIVHSVSA